MPSTEPEFFSPKQKVQCISNDCGKPSIVLGYEPWPVLVEVFFARLAWPVLYVALISFVFQDAVFSAARARNRLQKD
jgi:hypothetical protein